MGLERQDLELRGRRNQVDQPITFHLFGFTQRVIQWHSGTGGATVSKPVGRYDVKEMGLPNDSISSIKVTPGYRVIVYEHGNFGGRSRTFTSDVPCLADVREGNWNWNWNDQISSYVVEVM